MRALALAVVCLAVGAGLGWQGKVQAAPSGRTVSIGLDDTAVMPSVNMSCTVIHHKTAVGNWAICTPVKARAGDYGIEIEPGSLMITRSVKGGSKIVFTAGRPRR